MNAMNDWLFEEKWLKDWLIGWLNEWMNEGLQWIV